MLAGTLVADGAFAVRAALVGAAATAIGLTNGLSSNDWARLGTGSAIAGAMLTRRAVSGKYRPDGGRQPGDERPRATPARDPDDQDADGQGRCDHHRSGGGGASRVD